MPNAAKCSHVLRTEQSPLALPYGRSRTWPFPGSNSESSTLQQARFYNTAIGKVPEVQRGQVTTLKEGNGNEYRENVI